jgi:hypothetical protein
MFADTLDKDYIVNYNELFSIDNSDIININIPNKKTIKCKYDVKKNLEFIITFKKIKKNNDIIYDTFHTALNMLIDFFSVMKKNTSKVSITMDSSAKTIESYIIQNEKFLLLSQNWINGVVQNTVDDFYKEIQFIPQCTLKIKFENVFDVMLYINDNIKLG